MYVVFIEKRLPGVAYFRLWAGYRPVRVVGSGRFLEGMGQGGKVKIGGCWGESKYSTVGVYFVAAEGCQFFVRCQTPSGRNNSCVVRQSAPSPLINSFSCVLCCCVALLWVSHIRLYVCESLISEIYQGWSVVTRPGAIKRRFV